MDLSQCIDMDVLSKTMINDAINAVTKADMWEILKDPKFPGEDGFMFSRDTRLELINKNMEYESQHSGFSYGWTMRQVEYIAKNGFEAFVTLWNKSKKREQFLKETHTDMTLSEQVSSLEKFKDVPMSYSEMRERYG